MVMDQHGAHWTKMVVVELQRQGISPVYLSPNSSEMNPVERIWSVMKSRFRSWLIQMDGALTRRMAQERLIDILDQLEPSIVHNIAKSRYCTML